MKNLTFLLSIVLTPLVALAQDNADLLDLLEETHVSETFNASLGLNYHTTETLEKGTLSFALGHRFGKVKGGYPTFFGFDEFVSWRLDFQYGITDRLSTGIARNSLDKLHDVYLKYKVLRQRTDNQIPITITFLPRLGVNGNEFTELEQDIYSTRHRLSYAFSVLIGRKLNEKTSVQLIPMVIHQNLTNDREENNTSVALGGLWKYKFSRTASVMVEYAHDLNYESNVNETYYGAFAIGLDLTTFSHNFSIMVTNSVYMVENQSIPFNHGNFLKDEIRIGFNISRNFIL